MTRSFPRLRHQLGKDASLSEQFRDAQQAFDGFPLQLLRKAEMQYAEPMVLGGFRSTPEAIEAIRVVDMAAQETPLPCGGLCHFVWKPQQGGAQIMSIDGMSTAANGGKTYRFTFRVTFAPMGGL